MAGFIKSQSLTLLEKLDAPDADEQAAMCEKLHELAEELQNHGSLAAANRGVAEYELSE
ncbi:TPA: Rop family plasmid primer RNA-binding protein [Escherichia coli]|nr:Rop family plasmid primer RNA-binding protein [Escherichia coli]